MDSICMGFWYLSHLLDRCLSRIVVVCFSCVFFAYQLSFITYKIYICGKLPLELSEITYAWFSHNTSIGDFTHAIEKPSNQCETHNPSYS